MWAIPETHSARALHLAQEWIGAGTRLVAPCLLLAEVNNALYKRVRRRELDLSTAREALAVILGFGIEIREEAGLGGRAMEWAARLEQPTSCDGHYLALAERYRCGLWTGDRRLFQAAHLAAPWLHWVGEA